MRSSRHRASNSSARSPSTASRYSAGSRSVSSRDASRGGRCGRSLVTPSSGQARFPPPATSAPGSPWLRGGLPFPRARAGNTSWTCRLVPVSDSTSTTARSHGAPFSTERRRWWPGRSVQSRAQRAQGPPHWRTGVQSERSVGAKCDGRVDERRTGPLRTARTPHHR